MMKFSPTSCCVDSSKKWKKCEEKRWKLWKILFTQTQPSNDHKNCWLIETFSYSWGKRKMRKMFINCSINVCGHPFNLSNMCDKLLLQSPFTLSSFSIPTTYFWEFLHKPATEQMNFMTREGGKHVCLFIKSKKIKEKLFDDKEN